MLPEATVHCKSRTLGRRRLGVRAWTLVLVAYLVVLTGMTGIANRGFLAVDDSLYLLPAAIPAEAQADFASMGWDGSLRPPIPKFFRAIVVRLIAALGVGDPYGQFLGLNLLCGVLGLAALLTFVPATFTGRRRFVATAATAIGGLTPFLLSRFSDECLAMSFVAATGFFACRYVATARRRWLLAALAATTLGSLVRYQVGIYWVVLLAMAASGGRWRRDVPLLLGASLVAFVLSGLPDLAATGTFHQALREYVAYNRVHSVDYGRSNPWVFVTLTAAIAILPCFLTRYPRFSWRDAYRPLWPVVAFYAMFVFFHSVEPHKEERFLVPALPALTTLLVPLLDAFVADKRYGRLALYAGANVLVALVLLTAPSQQNHFAIVDFFRKTEPPPATLYGVDSSLRFFPTRLLSPRPTLVEPVSIDDARHRAYRCDERVAVRADLLVEETALSANLRPIGRFEPSWVDRLAIALNPSRNGRREGIVLFAPSRCTEKESR